MRGRCGFCLFLTLSLVALLGSGEASAQSKRRLVIYSSQFVDVMKALKAGFEASHPGVTVEAINPGGTEVIIAKLKAERSNPQADLMHSGFSLEYVQAVKEGVLQPSSPARLKELPTALTLGGAQIPLSDKEGYYHVYALQFGGIVYNTERVKALGLSLPKSYEELTKPEYRGQLLAIKPQKSSTAFTLAMSVYQAYGEKRVWEIWEGLNANIPFYTEKSSAVYSLVGKGEAAFALAGSRSVYRDQARGFKVEFIYPTDGSMVLDNCTGVVKGAKNPDLAEEFINYLLSPEGQVVMAQTNHIPVRPGVKAPRPEASLEWASKNIPRVLVPDPVLAAAKRDEVMRRFDAYTQGRSR